MRIFMPHLDNLITRTFDPLTGLLSSLLWATMLCQVENNFLLFVLLAVPVIILLLARIPFVEVYKRLLRLNVFLIFLFLLLPLSYGRSAEIAGADGVRFQVLSYDMFFAERGFTQALGIFIKANSIMLLFTAMVCFYEPAEIGKALQKIYMPEKIIVLFLFTIRYIDTIHHEYHRLRDAMKVRGFKVELSFYCMRIFGILIGQILVRSFERSKRVLSAMKCRGFTGRFYFTDKKRLKVYDYAALVFFAGLFCGVVYFG